MKGRGYIPDPDGHVVTDVHHLLGTPPDTSPREVSLESYVPTIFDQGSSNSCTGNATSGAIATHFAAVGMPLSFLPSRMGIYTLGRCIDRVPGANRTLPQLTDDGAMPTQVMRGITEWGISSESSWPFDVRRVNEEPTLDELETTDVRLDGQYRINAAGELRVRKIRQALASNYTIPFGVAVDRAFEDWNGKDPIGAPDMNNLLGWHYLYAVGYETSSKGETLIHFVNSWGKPWGQRGIGIGNAAFIEGARDLYVMDLMKGAS